MKAVLGAVAIGFFLLAGLFYVGQSLSRLPRVWRGETLPSLPSHTWRGPEINHRSYPVATLWITLFMVGIVLALIGAKAHVLVVGTVGILMMLAAVFLVFPLWLLVNAVNRPRFVVPPTRRSEQGWLAARRTRRERRREGKPPETHEVEVLDVRPDPTDEKHQFPPYFVARCAHDDCDWMGDIVDASEGDAEQRVRREAETHSAQVTGPIRPVG